MRRLFLSVAFTALASASYAANETFDVSFGAGFFFSEFGQSPPIDPVFGNFRITIDPTQTYQNETAGLSNLFTGALNFAGPLSFTYSPTGVVGDSDPGELVIGGLEDGAARILLTDPAQDDFILQVPNFFSTSDFQQFLYSQSAVPGVNLFDTRSAQSGFVDATRVVSDVPEPSAWTLGLIGFAVMGFVGWRRGSWARPSALSA